MFANTAPETRPSLPATLPTAPPPTPPATPLGRPRSLPFRDAAEAWFWTMAALRARHDGARTNRNPGAVPRPCEPDDVMKCLDQLYRQRRIDLAHARILRIWGERGIPPGPRDTNDTRLWRDAMAALDAKLRAKGIVG